jgi:hypothetical protein
MKRFYPAPTDEHPLVLSSSAIASFKRCRKAYEFGYEMLIDGGQNAAMAAGSSFHLHMANWAKTKTIFPAYLDIPDPMYDVAVAYINNNPDKFDGETIAVEEPFFTKLHGGKVYTRCTYDYVYRDADGWIVLRDYKTFEKAPTLDIDLDFQGRFYIADAMRRFGTDKVRFEYDYVRRVPPGSKNSKGVWLKDECYKTFPLVISRREADDLYEETLDVIEDIVYARASGRFYRSDLKGSSPYTCGSCLFKDVCKSEVAHGDVTPEDVEAMQLGFREPLTLPKEMVNA